MTRQLHIVSIAPGLPDPSRGGGGNWHSVLLAYFVEVGHRLTIIYIEGKHNQDPVRQAEIKEIYRQLGVDVRSVPYQRPTPKRRGLRGTLRTILRPRFSDLWSNESATRPLIMNLLRELKPDLLIPIAFDGVLYSDGYDDAPRIGIQAEGPHINLALQWRYDPEVPRALTLAYLSFSIRCWVLVKLHERISRDLTRRLTVGFYQGPQYVDWARRKGLTNTIYVTTPVPDGGGPDWRTIQNREEKKDSPAKILMIGHLSSTSNRSGLPIFFEEILPTFEREWGLGNFEVHIVGRNDTMPHRFDRFRDHPALIFRGPIYPADYEFQSCNVLLVPIPAPTGSRVRILNGFSFGCCVVAHSMNQLGIPELGHEENCLLATRGRDIARQTMRAAGDKALRRRLAENGHKIYENFYSKGFGGEQYLELIEKVQADWSAQ